MHVGRALGTALLALVDALTAGVLAGIGAFYVLPVYVVSDPTQLAVLATAVVTGVLLALSLALVGLGRRPFPATRLLKAGVDRLPWWA